MKKIPFFCSNVSRRCLFMALIIHLSLLSHQNVLLASEQFTAAADKNLFDPLVSRSCESFGKEGNFYKRPLVDVPNSMPLQLREFMRKQHFGYFHDKWHTTHSWDNRILTRPGVRVRALCSGWERFPRQMGQPGSGLDFLAMHRLMLDMMRKNFPDQQHLLAGWDDVPTDPKDPNNPLPLGRNIPFGPLQLNNLDRLKNDLGSFESDDQVGLFLWTSLSNPAIEVGSIHLYLHVRWADFLSDVNLANEVVNFENIYFWRLHGWIDRVWSDFRNLKGLSEEDPAYQAAIQQANLEMEHQHTL